MPTPVTEWWRNVGEHTWRYVHNDPPPAPPVVVEWLESMGMPPAVFEYKRGTNAPADYRMPQHP